MPKAALNAVPTASPVKARHILAVDDDALGLELLAEGLTAAGYQVACAESGEDALEYARNRQFDLAIVDMQMPGISGAELAKRLLGSFGCFSLILSGLSDAASIRAAVEDGALAYLVKPIDIPRLIPAIETALARSAELSQLTRSREHLNVALREGRETSVAIGILAERMHLDREAAFVLLRDTARNGRRRVVQVAEEIIQATETLNRIGRPAH